MRNCLRVFILWIACSNGFGQTIQELEYELSYFIGNETYSDKIDIARNLLEIDPLNTIAIDFTFSYYRESNIDSISLFIDDLLKTQSNKSQVYLIGANSISYYDWFNTKEYSVKRLEYLNLALYHDKNSQEALFYLAETYYVDFIRPLFKERNSIFSTGDPIQDSLAFEELRKTRKTYFEHSADSALKYCYSSWELDESRRNIIYFPIKQLECYLDKKDIKHISLDDISTPKDCVFPSWYFMDLNNSWQCDYTYNYLDEAEFSNRTSYWLTVQLKDLEEPGLFYKVVEDDHEIFRFTWLRSFDNPISIRIENSQNKIVLYWKVGRGAAGYEPEGIKRSGKKKIREHQWNEFIRLIDKSDFNTLPKEVYVPMNDGASWTLEKKSSNVYRAHNTNEPTGSFRKACLYLLELSKIGVPEKNIY